MLQTSVPDKSGFLGQNPEKAGSLTRHPELLSKRIWNTANVSFVYSLYGGRFTNNFVKYS